MSSSKVFEREDRPFLTGLYIIVFRSFCVKDLPLAEKQLLMQLLYDILAAYSMICCYEL